MDHRICFLRSIALIAGMTFGLDLHMHVVAQTPRERKNIDVLTDAEFASYEHALDLMQHDNGANGYQHFADLHDDISQTHGCEHQNDLFFPWHRSLLYYFEEALRKTDELGNSGPSTKDVTIPYWDWTVAPSGNRYPLRFEEENSPLSHSGRNDTHVTQPMYPKVDVFRIVNDTTDWPGFAGGPKSSPFFGAIESPIHNDMHSVYIGGDMGDPQFAAEDPIFWSFHAYIDLIWDRWQKVHNVEPTCLDCDLRGLPAEKKPKDLIRIRGQLGYFYRENETITPIILAQREAMSEIPKSRIIQLRPPVSIAGAAASEVTGFGGVKPLLFEMEIPREPFRTARLLFVDVTIPTSISYRGEIYLLEPGKPFEQATTDPNNPLAGRLSVWVGHSDQGAGHEHKPPSIYVDITERLRRLVSAHAGQKWMVGLQMEPIELKSKRAKDVARPSPPVEQQIHFGALRLVLNGNYSDAERELNLPGQEQEHEHK